MMNHSRDDADESDNDKTSPLTKSARVLEPVVGAEESHKNTRNVVECSRGTWSILFGCLLGHPTKQLEAMLPSSPEHSHSSSFWDTY